MRSACLLMLFLASVALAAEPGPARLLRFPDIHGDRVVFSSGGDLWTASTSGGTAVRLTSHPGLELFGKFSPDGRSIAFTGQYGGDEQVYVMPAAGGVARQLTFYPASGPRPDRWGYDNQVYGWVPDGTGVLFRSERDGFDYNDARLFTVPASGGMPTALPMTESGAGDYSPDGRRIVYSPLWRDFRTWKRYQGGWAQDLWVFDLDHPGLTRVTDHPRTDRDPMWIGNAIWFVSDRDGTLNLYRYDLASRATEQVTRHRDADVRWASADAQGRIVYELKGSLHIYDTAAASDRELEIVVPDDGASRRPERIAVKDNIEMTAVAPTGERIAIIARGDLFTVPAKDGVTRNLTRSSDAHDREVAWSRDGKQLAFVSDRTGEEELWLATHDDAVAPRQLTRGSKTRYLNPRFSPDGSAIAVADKDGRLLVVSSRDGTMTVVADDILEFARDHAWSPDGRYLAFSLADPTGFRGIHVWSKADGRSRRVTPELFNSFIPAWDPAGEYLYFLSVREFAPQVSTIEWNFAANRATGVFALALTRKAANPFAPRNDEVGSAAAAEAENEESGSAGGTGPNAKDKAPPMPEVTIEFDGIVTRAIRVPIDVDNYDGLAVTADTVLARRVDAPYYGRDGAVKPSLIAWSIKDRKATTLAENVDAWSVTGDGKQVLVALGSKELKLLEVGGENKDVEPVKLDGLYATRIPAQEWNTIFNEAWRRFRDYFYVPNMHGYDWEGIRNRYAPLVAHVAHRADLNYVIGEMIAELNVSHAYVQDGDLRLPTRPFVALPGARFVPDTSARRYRLSEIFVGQNEEERYRSPLTEVGVDARVGDYVLAINGRELTTADNPWELMIGEAGQLVEWRLASDPVGKDARTVRFKPIASEDDLLYLAWVRRNMARVSDATQGRVGYIHLPDMGENGIREFVKWWFPQLRKEGLVVDVRGNGGGNISAMLIDRLSRKLLGLDYSRGSAVPSTYPTEVMAGPMVALINETSASDGDIFPWQFRNAGLGPLIGKRTWGGVIGINDRGPLLDGGLVFVPEFGTADANGQWAVEGEGVTPDIEVEQDPVAVISGSDPQLARGIAEVMNRLPATAQPLPQRPASPVKTP